MGTYVASSSSANLGVSLAVNVAVGLNLLLGALAVGFGFVAIRWSPWRFCPLTSPMFSLGARVRSCWLRFFSGSLPWRWRLFRRDLDSMVSSTVYAFSIMLASFLFAVLAEA